MNLNLLKPFSLFTSPTCLLVVVAAAVSQASIIQATVTAGEPSTPVAGHCISFDLPPTAVAIPVTLISDQSSDPATPPSDATQPRSFGPLSFGASEAVEVSLRLSSLVCGTEMPQIDRWIVRCVPRDPDWQIIDYAPRTETASEFAGPIQVKETEDETRAFGLSTDAAPIHIKGAFVGASGHMGYDQGEKHGRSTQFDRHAPLHAVTASGTIERGRGVYYKLRWTSTQVLEGEKEFKMTFAVPDGFRAGLVDVSVVAIGKPAANHGMSDAFSQIPVLGGDSDRMRAIGEGRFVVAVHAEGDPVAWKTARSMVEAEISLRRQARGVIAKSPATSLSTIIRHVAAKFDVDRVDVHGDWIERLVFQNADPYNDPIIRKLPTELRVAALDYVDARRQLQTLSTRRSSDADSNFQLNELVTAAIQPSEGPSRRVQERCHPSSSL